MKKILAVLMMVCTIFAVQAKDISGNQDLKKEQRFLEGFEQINVNANFNVNLVYAISPKVEVEAESNLLQYIVTEVKGKTLNINVQKKIRLANNFPITIYIAMPTISKLQYTGEGNISVDGIPSEKMDIILTGKGDCNWSNLKTGSWKVTANKNFNLNFTDMLCGSTKMVLNDNCKANFQKVQMEKLDLQYNTVVSSQFVGVQTESLNIQGNAAGSMTFSGFAGKDVSATLTSTGNVTMSGTAKSVTVNASNAAGFDAIDLAAEKAKIVNNGTANVQVSVTSSLDANITSTGSVFYKGTPKIKIANTGTGQIMNKN